MRLALVAAAFGLLAACAVDESVAPVPRPGRDGVARAMHTFTRDLPDDLREQTVGALERDAFRREFRFLEAAEPGLAFSSTRVPASELAAGLWSPAEIYELGAQLFHVTFTPRDGRGGADLPAVARFHTGRRGGPDAGRCSACHWRGGIAGAGDGADDAYLDGDGDRQSSALARNPIALAGAGLVELLAREMSADLAAQRDAAWHRAQETGKPQTATLTTKSIAFGSLGVSPDGTLDTSHVDGVGPDLVVRPFGWKGNVASLRDAVEDALLVHHGMESTSLVASAPPERVGAFGGIDPDGDGVTDEISEGQVQVLTLFIAMQEVPVLSPPTDSDQVLAFADGRALFDSLGCATCHTPSLTLASARFTAGPVTIDLAADGAPRVAQAAGGYAVPLFSDLKRHDLGPGLGEARDDRGAPASEFMTRPLWGVARSRPYLHDGRAPTLEDAILMHGGEAQASRDAFAALDDVGRAPLRVFLTSLTRARRIMSP